MITVSFSSEHPVSDLLSASVALSHPVISMVREDVSPDEIDELDIVQEYQTTRTCRLDYGFSEHEKMMFPYLEAQWRKERGITSSISDMVMCPSYLKIIGMGKIALPLILAQLKREGDDPNHWFTALEAITGEDPVPEDAYGDTVRMAAAWLTWAEKSNAW